MTQWALTRLALLTPMMATSSAVLGGILLIAVGLYQWTPLGWARLLRRGMVQFAQGIIGVNGAVNDVTVKRSVVNCHCSLRSSVP
jgi:hypothetical protein